MPEEITISRKRPRTGGDNFKIVSVRMRDDLLQRLEVLSKQTNRSKNELINLLLTAAVEKVKIED